MDSILLLSQNRGNIIPYCLSLFPFCCPPLESSLPSSSTSNLVGPFHFYCASLPPLNAADFLSFSGPFCGCQSLTRHKHTLPKDQKQRVEGQAAGILQGIHSATP